MLSAPRLGGAEEMAHSLRSSFTQRLLHSGVPHPLTYTPHRPPPPTAHPGEPTSTAAPSQSIVGSPVVSRLTLLSLACAPAVSLVLHPSRAMVPPPTLISDWFAYEALNNTESLHIKHYKIRKPCIHPLIFSALYEFRML